MFSETEGCRVDLPQAASSMPMRSKGTKVWIAGAVAILAVLAGSAMLLLRKPEPFESPVQLAGFYAAHAVWCISSGETLVPLIGHQSTDGAGSMTRLAHDRLDEAVASGKKMLDENVCNAEFAVLIYDGYVTLPAGKTDALIVSLRRYGPTTGTLEIVIPYSPASEGAVFQVHRPKVVAADGSLEPGEEFSTLFFAGVDRHGPGARAWTSALDQGK